MHNLTRVCGTKIWSSACASIYPKHDDRMIPHGVLLSILSFYNDVINVLLHKPKKKIYYNKFWGRNNNANKSLFWTVVEIQYTKILASIIDNYNNKILGYNKTFIARVRNSNHFLAKKPGRGSIRNDVMLFPQKILIFIVYRRCVDDNDFYVNKIVRNIHRRKETRGVLLSAPPRVSRSQQTTHWKAASSYIRPLHVDFYFFNNAHLPFGLREPRNKYKI